ncbi:MAG: N-acetyltransferase [Deltaproteobacteria bacterium]|nr:N-acetyltransferase [Deltaproteobacteria bacterium]MCB9785234.1 N-acetyltransferase [Deltaproteobacteria bacterium]
MIPNTEQPPPVYDEAWRERVEVPGCGRVRLRLIRPRDKRLLVRALAKLSPESQYRRFLSPKARLSERELRYLTELDGVRHLAIGAVRVDARGREREGLGVARYVVLPGETEVAEAAVTVIDEAQGKGLGRMLLRRLTDAARAHGVTHFRASVLATNLPMRRLLEEVAQGSVVVSQDGPLVELDVPITAQAPEGSGAGATASTSEVSPLERIMAAVAAGAVAVEHAVYRFLPGLVLKGEGEE